MSEKPEFLFSKINYLLMIAGVVLILIGFILMSGGGNSDPSTFDPEQVYSFKRITLAPLLILLGFAIEFVAIFKKAG